MSSDGGADGLAVDPAVSTFDKNVVPLSTPAVFVRDPNKSAPTGIIQTGGNSSYNKCAPFEK